MTAGLSLQLNRRAPALTREELRRQLLALVLACVLVWYTFVAPAGAAAARRFEPEDDADAGEVRRLTPRTFKTDPRPAEELDWPEYIYP